MAPLKDTHCVVSETDGNHVYEVRAVYSVGTSEATNPFDASVLGIDNPAPDTDAYMAGEKQYDVSGRIVQNGNAKGIHVVKGKKFVVK